MNSTSDSPALSYAPHGISRPGADAPAGFRVAERRIRLGDGDAVWDRAVAAVRGWAIKKGVGFTIHPDETDVVAERDHVTLFGVGPVRVREPVRVVWVADEADRRGFGYGTLPGHPLRGEESFLVERDTDGSVWFRSRTVSRVARSWWPLWCGIRLAQPLMQRRYARSAAHLVSDSDELPGLRGMRHGMVGDGLDTVQGIARLGYGMGGPRGPFDEPPAEPVDLDPDELPWELRGGSAGPEQQGDSTGTGEKSPPSGG